MRNGSNLLCDKADNEYGGRLPVHVRCLLDEFANIGVEAAALDMAGNETTSEMHKVLVTSSVWIQYINNTPLLIGSILGIVLVAGGLIWFFVIRKKKEESK